MNLNNDNDNKGSSYTGPSFFGFLFLIFMTLKLTGRIDWSWWWVTAPLWGQLILALGLILLCVIVSIFKK